MTIRVRNVLDSWRFWSVVSYVILALAIVWLATVSRQTDRTAHATRVLSRANSNAIVYLCHTNRIVEALTNQAIYLLLSDVVPTPPSVPLRVTVGIFQGYADTLHAIAPCVKAVTAARK